MEAAENAGGYLKNGNPFSGSLKGSVHNREQENKNV